MLGLKPKKFAAVQDRVKAEAWEKVKSVALIDGGIVLSTHKDFIEGNIALCKVLDEREANGICAGHALELCAVSYIPTPGENIDRRNTVWLP